MKSARFVSKWFPRKEINQYFLNLDVRCSYITDNISVTDSMFERLSPANTTDAPPLNLLNKNICSNAQVMMFCRMIWLLLGRYLFLFWYKLYYSPLPNRLIILITDTCKAPVWEKVLSPCHYLTGPSRALQFLSNGYLHHHLWVIFVRSLKEYSPIVKTESF